MRRRTARGPGFLARGFLLPVAWLLLAANAPDDLREIVTVTVDANGEARARRVWFVHLDDTLFVRTTPRATWGQNALRAGEVTIASELGRAEYRVVRVEDATALARVHAQFREKYGVRDVGADLVRFFFGGKIVLRLEFEPQGEETPRTEGAPIRAE